MSYMESQPEECVDLVKVISRQNIEVASWLLLAACINISTHAVQCLCPAKVLRQFQQVLYLQSVSMRSLIKQSE